MEEHTNLSSDIPPDKQHEAAACVDQPGVNSPSLAILAERRKPHKVSYKLVSQAMLVFRTITIKN